MHSKSVDRKVKIIVVILLSMVSFIAALTKIFIGLEIDEEFVIVQGYRLYNGEHMFSDMWEIWQTSSIFIFPFIKIWESFHGGSEYVILFLRFICTIVHLGITILLYRTLLKCNNRFYSFCIACLYFNFLPKWIMNFEYENLLIMCLALTSIFLYKTNVNADNSIRKCRIYAVLAGVCFSMAVLAYPTALVLFPMYLVVILILFKDLYQREGKRGRNVVILWFSSTCFFMAIFFCVYIFQNISISEFIHTLPYLLADSTHDSNGKILKFLKESPILFLRACIPGVLAWISSYLVEKYNKHIEIFVYRWICLWNVYFVFIIFVSNLLGRHSGPFGLQTRHLVLFFCNLYLIRYLEGSEKQKVLFLWITGLFTYLAVLMATNLSLEVSASSLILGMLGSLLAICSWKMIDSKEVKMLKFFTLLILTLGIIFNKGFFVTIEGTGPASILEKRVQVKEGPLRGIWIYEDDYASYKNKAYAIVSNTNTNDTMLYLSRHALGNLFGKGDFISVSGHGTVSYDEQWVAYWEDFEHQKPTVVVIDSEKINDLQDFLEGSPFGKWIEKNYKTQNAFFENGVWFIR